MATARWAKLRDGEWGVRIDSVVPDVTTPDGDWQHVMKRDGTDQYVRLGRRIWKGAGISLWTVISVISTGGRLEDHVVDKLDELSE